MEYVFAQLVIKNTFLHFELKAKYKPRSQSTPPRLFSQEAPKKKQIKEDDDELALKEGRSLVLAELWLHCASKIFEKTFDKISEELEVRRMKYRLSIKSDCFFQLIKMINFTDHDVIVLRMMGILRETENGIAIWCTDDQIKNKCMTTLIKEGKQLLYLSKDYVFLMIDTKEASLIIKFDGSLTLLSVREKVRAFWKLPFMHRVKLQRLNGDELVGRTLKKCKIKPGDVIRAVF